MRLWRRRGAGIRVVVLVDGREYPAWALRAGCLITATDYDHGKGTMVVQVERQAQRAWDEGNTRGDRSTALGG